LAQVTEDLPPPGPGEALVRIEAIGLNCVDVFACLGLYSATPPGAFIPGLECAVVIEALGPSRAGDEAASTCIAPGDRVMVLTRFGGYATALHADTRYLVPMPRAKRSSIGCVAAASWLRSRKVPAARLRTT